MRKILFICRANICRSQMAEGYYNFFAGEKLAMSAGVEDYGQKYNYSPTPDIIAVMKEENIDISKHKIKTVHKSMVEEVDKVIVFCSKGVCPEYIIKSDKTSFIHIPDPFAQSMERIREIRDRIKSVILDMFQLEVVSKPR